MNTSETASSHFIFNREHEQLLTLLQNKTGKDRQQLVRDAVHLALSKKLGPASYRWNKKENRSVHVRLTADDAAEAKKLWKGKLTPLAVSGLLEMARAEEIQRPDVGDFREIRAELARLSQLLDSLIRTSTAEQSPRNISDNGAAALAVRATLRKLVSQLDYFKRGTDADRRRFREIVDPVEVGYATSILKALFDEDGFQRWMLATEYMGRPKND